VGIVKLHHDLDRPVFLTSDTHFFHKKMADLRKFGTDVDAHNEMLIKNWNRMVPMNGHVFHLGDVSFGNQEKSAELFSRLNGSVDFVPGNHDNVNLLVKLAELKGGMVHQALTEVLYTDSIGEKNHITLCHFPLAAWNMSDHGSWHFHGHLHGATAHHWCAPYEGAGTRIDIGVDCAQRLGFWPLSPVILESLIAHGRRKQARS
jgi:calcineurin-like phosphoesterase family protein